nr:hypothetical protein [uncultured Chitinophaga sp.]
MKKISVVWGAISALIGIGGAYASVYRESNGLVHYTYNWYLTNGQYAFTATIDVAKAICPAPLGTTCLVGTASKYHLQTAFVFKP